MMKPFYSTPERIAALEAAAIAWKGTPFRLNSCARGTGASCHFAIVGVLIDSGFPLDIAAVPRGAAGWSRNNTRSIQAEWLDNQKNFAALRFPDSIPPLSSKLADFLLPGDVVGFHIGQCIHHVGIILPAERFLQCRLRAGTEILSMQEREFGKRLSRAWRPLETWDSVPPELKNTDVFTSGHATRNTQHD